MIAAAVLLATLAVASPTCARPAASKSVEAGTPSVSHTLQNGQKVPLRLFWIDPQGKEVDQGVIAPGAFLSIRTFIGHTFKLTDPAGRCRKAVRIGDVFAGTYVGTSRYRPVAVRPEWHVLIDQALDPAAEPARTALATVARMLEEAEAVLPPAALLRVRTAPIFLHDHAGPGGMFHRDPNWLITHGRSVEMVDGMELSDAGFFIETAKVQPGAILHELAHAYHARLPEKDRAEIDRVYRRMMDSGRYRKVARGDGSITDAYARTNAAEYFAELSEAYFSRNDFFPFTRSELVAYDPDGERLIAELWR
ncbi:hypothetical protein [Sphingomonas sp.]|uniref:hypothetical protein n=1 Tax=Sphingomonas sp. TaxID=28214 RepID=UPI002ED86A60